MLCRQRNHGKQTWRKAESGVCTDTQQDEEYPVYSVKQIKKSDIEMLFPDIREDTTAVEFLLCIAQSPQAIRGAVNLYSNALDNGNVTAKGLSAIAKYMDMAV